MASANDRERAYPRRPGLSARFCCGSGRVSPAAVGARVGRSSFHQSPTVRRIISTKFALSFRKIRTESIRISSRGDDGEERRDTKGNDSNEVSVALARARAAARALKSGDGDGGGNGAIGGEAEQGGDSVVHRDRNTSDHRYIEGEDGWRKFNKIMLGRAVQSSKHLPGRTLTNPMTWSKYVPRHPVKPLTNSRTHSITHSPTRPFMHPQFPPISKKAASSLSW